MASSSSPASSSRKLSSLETRLHQSGLQAGRPLTQREIDVLAPDPHARTESVNFLLAAGLLKLMRDTNGNLSYRAVQKNELDAKKGLSGEESMVLGHIQAAANQGIWTKHLKAKTELHQTVIDRCLKSLVQKQLIKSVKGVKYPTRKIYMMAHLEPSVELTGGPWYTDNELDTEFIKLLCSACLRYIRERTLPKHKHDEGSSFSLQPLYPVNAGISYPNAKEVLAFLTKSKITETQFTEEHVEMLLNVLVLDGEVERFPTFGVSTWADNDLGDDAFDDSSSTSSTGAVQKRRKAKGKRRPGGDGTSSSTEDGDGHSRNQPSKKVQSSRNKRKKRKRDRGGMSDSGSSEGSNVKRRKKRKTDDDDSKDEEDGHTLKRVISVSGSTSRSMTKSGGRGKASEPASQSDTGSSDSENDSEEGSKSTRLRSSSRKTIKLSQSKRRARTRSPLAPTSLGDKFFGSSYVYRAVRQERVALGWSEAPCGGCPVFGFCKEGGPVGPSGCEYFGEWLKKAAIARDS
ncbi:RNA polymerase Rpc34 subunit-domain-containing protein [Multifurca ochricompacta]|uniref:RNA polymerase Rpc34 subunit-domain-containing protein n=1 Tax=Multifurca ochricompacta TaxID=376703 RepID=A0AAD4QN19_9AGAM|nr:RNA polymerase Rpc34 subunit-domain-containing protein [Multifurca ochricompacta]